MKQAGWIGLAVVTAASLAALVTAVTSQPGPASIPGCVFNSSLPTLTDKQTVALQCDSSGRIILKP